MGTGIALVSALRAKVPVLLHDRSQDQVIKGLAFVDKLLQKDVSKGRISSEEAKEARDRITGVDGVHAMRDVDMVVEVSTQIPGLASVMLKYRLQAVSENLSLKQKIFQQFATEMSPEAILASNTSSISITKIAASTILEGVSAASDAGKKTAGRVVGSSSLPPTAIFH